MRMRWHELPQSDRQLIIRMLVSALEREEKGRTGFAVSDDRREIFAAQFMVCFDAIEYVLEHALEAKL